MTPMVKTQVRESWERLVGDGVRFHTSVSVVMDTFTFLDRNATRAVALGWKGHLPSCRA
jgi:hypothetical protein